MQLELVAWLLAGEIEAESQGDAFPPIRAREILAELLARWVGPLRADIEAASLRFGAGVNPYLALARLLETAVLAEVGETRGEARPSPGIDPEIARLRRQYAERAINAEDLTIIRARLAADGLPSGLVTIPVDARDRAMGLATMTPSEAERLPIRAEIEAERRRHLIESVEPATRGAEGTGTGDAGCGSQRHPRFR